MTRLHDVIETKAIGEWSVYAFKRKPQNMATSLILWYREDTRQSSTHFTGRYIQVNDVGLSLV